MGKTTLASLAGWRAAVGMVPQEPFLFHDTVRANLLWARPAVAESLDTEHELAIRNALSALHGRLTMLVIAHSDEDTARAYTAPYYCVVRAKIVLLAADGVPNTEIAERLDTSPQVVHRWRKRFFEEVVDGLSDRPRSGAPASFPPHGRR